MVSRARFTKVVKIMGKNMSMEKKCTSSTVKNNNNQITSARRLLTMVLRKKKSQLDLLSTGTSR